MKRVLLWILGIVIVLGVAGTGLLGRINTQFVVKQIADATAKATGKPLIFASAPSLSLLPLGVKFGKTDWGEIKDGRGLAVSVKSGMVELELTPLFSGNLVVREVRLDNPVLEIHEGNAVAAAPTQLVPDQVHEQSLQGQTTAVAAAPSDELPVELMRLVVRQGEVRYVDAQGMTLHIENLNLSVENLRRREEAGVQCDFAFDLRENVQKAVLAGNLALDAKLRYYAPHLTFRQISLSFTPLNGLLTKEAGPAQLICEGALNLQTSSLRLATARLTTPQARLTIGGEATLTPPTFKGNVSLEGSPRKLAALAGQKLKPVDDDVLSFKSSLEYAGDNLHLRQIVMQLDDIPLRGDLSLGLGTPLAVSGGIQAGMLNLDAYLPLPESGRAVASAPAVTGGKPGTDKAPAAKSAQSLPSVNLRAALSGVRQGKLSVTNIAFILKGEKGRYTVTSLSGSLDSGGSIKGSAVADLLAKAYSIKATAASVNVGGLLEALGKGHPVDGMATLDADLGVHGADAKAMLAGINGRGLLEVRNMHLAAMSALPKNVPGLTGKKGAVPDRFDLVRVPFTVRNGDVTAQPVTVSSAGLNASGRAQVSLPRKYMDAAADIKTLGMTIPVVAKGPFSDISYGVDPKFALDMAKKLLSAPQDGAQGVGGAMKKGLESRGGLVRGLFGK
ncbi:AsmA family protein [uncultured Desulfovibrio sp.]|uniref:AsmA family protein n=1 Tax=uncultured Desulfovibrio sp. TaxID=167968 RepID=UPI0003AA4656|nr:AsmA family protein [uncultured Desulfovibrio sp.]